MDGLRDYHIKWSKSEKYKHDVAYVKFKKKSTNEFIYKTETDSQTQKTNLRLPKKKGDVE